MIKRMLAVFAFSLFVTAAQAVGIGTGGVSTAFSRGSTSVGVVAGSGSAFNDNYIILGLGVGYYVVKGLELGIDAQYWFSGDPAITKISPQVRYVFTQPKTLKPYLGAFYRRTFISSDIYDDYNSYGGRAGLYFSSSGGVYIGGGVVYEKYADCDLFVDCSNTYPEILFQVSF
ncbi:MAG TPA: hypothetical protein ENJ11_00325 [Gammaproteobacteria bacterium]|nr:hypothetical protein [Gammaproteobacteria bacterium]